MKKLILVAVLAVSAVGCGMADQAVNSAKSYAIEEGRKEIATRAGCSNDNANVGIRDAVVGGSTSTAEALRKENEILKAEAVEKDKKIDWLRKKAKDAGADLTK